MDYTNMHPQQVKDLIREGKIDYQTSGMCAGYAQANLCILPKEYAFDFLLFCMRNPKPCPILEVGDVGSREIKSMASKGDVCTDFPKYRIWKNGVLEKEVTDISQYWQDDFVYFLIGCSFSFEAELLEADVPVRHIEENVNVPMFNTNIELESAGVFHGNMVVSMRPIPNDLVVKAVNVTAAMPRVHGAPIQIGNPEAIGIKDVTKAYFFAAYASAINGTVRQSQLSSFHSRISKSGQNFFQLAMHFLASSGFSPRPNQQ